MIFKNKNILKIFLQHSIPMLLAISLLGVCSAFITLTAIRDTTQERAESTLNQAITYYDSIMDEIDGVNRMLAKNKDILTNLKQVHELSQMDYQLFRETQLVKSFFASSANTRPTISSIFLYIDNESDYILYSGSGYEKLEEVREKEWVEEYMKKETTDTLESERRGYNIVRLSRAIQDRDKEKIGVIIVDVRISELTDYFDKDTSLATPHLEVSNEKGESLFSYAKAEFNDKNPFVVEKDSSKYGWHYTLSYSRRQLFAPSYTIIRFTILAILIAAGIGLVATYRANLEERRFINNLIETLNQAGAELEQPKEDENIFVRLDDLILKRFLEQDYLKLRAEALEYRALQLQINPHFLFNSLNNMYWKSIKMTGGENDLSQMTKLLSNLMKHSLRFDNLKGIPLQEELASVDTYILMQHFRFKDTFDFKADIPYEYLAVPVPAMVFQPILENAFNHGFREGRLLTIRLTARRNGDYLKFIIKDDGNPFPESVLEGIRDKNAKALKSSSSLGILNTRDRIELFYSSRASMELSNEDGWATVTISIPFAQQV